jgi:ribonuclease HI
MAGVVVYTDGGCIGNPGPGGWAVVRVEGDLVQEHSGRYRQTTNNRMELVAAINGLELVERPSYVTVVTDSVYLRSGITQWIHRWQRNNWHTANRRPVKNRDLWERLLHAVKRHCEAGCVKWEWTKGHAGEAMNERADFLANQEARNVTESDPIDAPSKDDLPLFNVPPAEQQ